MSWKHLISYEKLLFHYYQWNHVTLSSEQWIDTMLRAFHDTFNSTALWEEHGHITWDLRLSSTGAVRSETASLDFHVGTQNICGERNNIMGEHIFGWQNDLRNYTALHRCLDYREQFISTVRIVIFLVLFGLIWCNLCFINTPEISKHLLLVRADFINKSYCEIIFFCWHFYCTGSRCPGNLPWYFARDKPFHSRLFNIQTFYVIQT